MATYTAAVRTPAAAAAAAYMAIRSGTAARIRIREIGAFTSAATASSIGLIRVNNTPNPTTSQLGQAQDPADPASGANLDTVWTTTLPTIGTSYLRRIALPATQSAGVIWTWAPDAPLVVAVGAAGSVVLWNFGAAAGAALDAYVVWDE